MLKIAIIDYEAGNIRNVYNALLNSGVTPIVTDDRKDLLTSDAIVLPGVGAAKDTMLHLKNKKLIEPINEFVNLGKPFLGICMGLQVLFDYSFEGGGKQDCLGIIHGNVNKFDSSLVVPHMGWNTINIVKKSPLLNGITSSDYFYFVHSFYPDPIDKSVILATTEYGKEFASIVEYKNIFATQFHPEKSGNIGLKIYENFINIVKNKK